MQSINIDLGSVTVVTGLNGQDRIIITPDKSIIDRALGANAQFNPEWSLRTDVPKGGGEQAVRALGIKTYLVINAKTGDTREVSTQENEG